MDQPLGKDKILASAKGSLKGLLTVWICTYCSCCLCFLISAAITQQATLWVLFYSTHEDWKCVRCFFYFGPSCVSCLQDPRLSLEFSCVSDCFLPTVKLNEASGWNRLTGLRSMLRVLVGWTDAHRRTEVGALLKENNKIWKKKRISWRVLFVLNILCSHVQVWGSFYMR